MKFLNKSIFEPKLSKDEEELVFRLVHRLGERERMVPDEEKEEISGSEKEKILRLICI